jgi:hypothetical protein
MSSQIQITGETKVKSLTGVLVGTTGVVSSLAFDVAGGVPKLDVNGKILVAQLPNSVMEYKGTWDASTNTPTLVNGTGNQGDVYLCNVAGTVDFGAGAIAFFVGDQVIYSGSIWQRASGATGTVTSVAVTESGDSLNITGSPITTSGTINIGFNGTNLQYVNGAGNLTTFPILTGFVPYTGATTSVDLGAFLLTASGVDSVGYTARGSGTLSGYLILKQGTTFLGNVVGYNSINANSTKYTFISDVDGTNYKQASFELGSLTNNTARTYTLPNANGTIALTSDIPILTGYVPYTGATANVDLGTFNLTADVITGATGSFTSNGGSDTFAINHSSGAGIALNITKGGNGEGLYINKTSGSGNAATIIGTLNATTLVKSGGTSSQFLKADGTVDSSTYALDSAVVHNTGNETVGGTKTFSDATKNNGGIFLQNASSNSLAGYMNLGGLTNGLKFTSGGGISNTFTLPSATGYTFTFPNATGTIALTSDLSDFVTLSTAQTISGTKTFTSFTKNDFGVLLNASGNYTAASGYNGFGGISNGIRVVIGQTAIHDLVFSALANYTYTFPSATGTIALVGGSGVGTVISVAALTIGTSGTDLSSTVATSTTTPVITLNVPTASAANRGALSSADWTTFNNKQSAITLTTTGTSGAATFSSNTLNIPNYGSALSGYLPLSGGTLTGALSGTSGTFSGILSSSGGDIRSTGTAADSVTAGPFISVRNASNAYQYLLQLNATYGLDFWTYGGTWNKRMTLDASGNLGLGVTPSAWSIVTPIMQIGSGGGFIGGQGSANVIRFGVNTYFNGSNWTYINSDYASWFETGSGAFKWYTSPSGTAGATVTTTQAMTLTAAGRLLIGTPTEATYMLDVNGTGRFVSSNNTTALTISAGSNATFEFKGNSTSGYAASFNINNTALYIGHNSASRDLVLQTASVDRLTISGSGAATFSSSVTATSGVFTQSAGLSFQALQTSATNSLTALIRQTGAGGNGNQDIGLVVDIQGANDQDRIANFRYFDGTNYNSRFVVQRGGNVGIGTSSPTDSIIGSGTFLDIAGTGGGALKLHFTNATAYGEFSFYKGSNGSYIDSAGAATLANNDLIFRTGGTVSNYGVTERMRITSGGALCLGVTSAYGTNLLNVNGGIYATSSVAAVVAADLDMMVFQNTGATYSKACLVASMTATGGTGSYFFYGQQSTSTAAIKIFSNGNIQNTNNSYGAISDARLKENIKDATPKLDDLMKVKVRNYNLKGESNKQLGVISQELEAIFPNMIEESTNMGENMKIKGVKYSVFVPMLIKAVQEQQQQINELKQLINK